MAGEGQAPVAQAAPPPAPAPGTYAPPAGSYDPNQATETIESLSDRIKTKFPDYEGVDDRELVHRVLAKHPEYQNRLKDGEVQRLANNADTAPDEKEGFFSHALDTVGRQVRDTVGSLGNSGVVAAYRNYSDARDRGKGVGDSIKETLAKGMIDSDAGQAVQDVANYGKRRQQGYGRVYSAFAPAMSRSVGVNLPEMEKAAGQGNVEGVQAEAAVPAGEVLAGELARVPAVQRAGRAVAKATSGIRDNVAEGIARPTLSRPMSKVRTDRIYGHSPEAAIVGENVSTVPQVKAKMDEVGQALSDQLNAHGNVTIDNAKIIRNTFNQFIQDAAKHGKNNVVSSLESARDAYLNNWGNMNKSPRATSDFKSQLYGEVKWRGGDDAATTVDNARRAAAAGMRDAINNATGDPKIKELNQRYGDLASARDSLQRKADSAADKGMVAGAKENVVNRGARKAAQIIGTQYDQLTPPQAQAAQLPQQAPQPAQPPTNLARRQKPAPGGAMHWQRTTNLQPTPTPNLPGGAGNALPPQAGPSRPGVPSRSLPQQAARARGNPSPPSTGEIRDLPANRVVTPEFRGGDLSRVEGRAGYQEPAPTFVNRRTGSKVTEVNKQGSVGDGTPKSSRRGVARPTAAKAEEAPLSPAEQEKADRTQMKVLEARMNSALDTRRGSRTPKGYQEADARFQKAKADYYAIRDKYPAKEAVVDDAPARAVTASRAEHTPPRKVEATAADAEKPPEGMKDPVWVRDKWIEREDWKSRVAPKRSDEAQDEREAMAEEDAAPKDATEELKNFFGTVGVKASEAASTATGKAKAPTFYALSAEEQEGIADYAKQIPHLPQSARMDEMADLHQYGTDGTPLKERIAMRMKNPKPAIGAKRTGRKPGSYSEEIRQSLIRDRDRRSWDDDRDY